tara:strand:+ start:933 stop:1217 length:285 start_codon:yes stop_codon:yes gene_type:complete
MQQVKSFKKHKSRQEKPVLTQEELGKISDDDLYRRFKTIKNLIRSRKFSYTKARELEIEFCYLYREQEIRENRKFAHQAWMINRKTHRRVKERE